MTEPLLKRLAREFNVPPNSDKEAAKASGNPDTPQSDHNPGPSLQSAHNEQQSAQGNPGIDMLGMQNTIIQTLMAAQREYKN